MLVSIVLSLIMVGSGFCATADVDAPPAYRRVAAFIPPHVSPNDVVVQFMSHAERFYQVRLNIAGVADVDGACSIAHTLLNKPSNEGFCGFLKKFFCDNEAHGGKRVSYEGLEGLPLTSQQLKDMFPRGGVVTWEAVPLAYNVDMVKGEIRFWSGIEGYRCVAPCVPDPPTLNEGMCASGEAIQEEFWRKKLENAFANDGFVWVVRFDAKGEVSSATYDVRGERCILRYFVMTSMSPGPAPRAVNITLIQPVETFLSFHFLQGYVLDEGYDPPVITSADFSVKDLNKATCYREGFYDHKLADFLSQYAFTEKGKLGWGDVGDQLTQEALRKWLPSFKALRWCVVSQRGFLSAMTKKTKKKGGIFMVVPHEGILYGERKNCILGLCPYNIFDYKMSVARYRLQQRFPFSEEDAQKCINFKV